MSASIRPHCGAAAVASRSHVSDRERCSVTVGAALAALFAIAGAALLLYTIACIDAD